MTGEKAIAVAAFFLFVHSALAGDIKKRVDADGGVHFGDAPPPTSQSRDVVVQPAYGGTDTYSGGSGLRPGEQAILRKIERREQSRLMERRNSTLESELPKVGEAADASRKAYRKLQCESITATLKRHEYEQRQGYHNEGEKQRQKSLVSGYKGLVDYWCD